MGAREEFARVKARAHELEGREAEFVRQLRRLAQVENAARLVVDRPSPENLVGLRIALARAS